MNIMRSLHLHLSYLVLVSFLCIQAPAFAYSYGNPSAEEQEHLEHINRARANPDAEALITDISGINEGVSDDKIMSNTAKQPLVFNAKLSTSAAKHAQDMLDRNYFSHTTKDSTDNVGERSEAEGYDWFYIGENLAYRTTSDSSDIAWKLHYDLFNDKNVVGRGHRINILSENYKELGIGLRKQHVSGSSYKWMIAANFGKSYDNYQYAFLLGAIYDDSDNNDFYTAGEGLAGVTVTISGAISASTTTATAGGYAIYGLPAGNYNVTFSHATYGNVTKNFTVTGKNNVKVDATLDEFSNSNSDSGSSGDNSDSSSNPDESSNSGDNSDSSSNSGNDSDSSNNAGNNSDNNVSDNSSSDSSNSNNDSNNSNNDNSSSSNNDSSSSSSNTSSKKTGTTPSQPKFSLLNISSGRAHIISQPAGIDCHNGEGQCSHVFKLGTVVELFFAEELPEYLVFDGWNGDSDCKDNKVTLNKTINCAARIYGRAGFEIPPATETVNNDTSSSNTTADANNATDTTVATDDTSNSGNGSSVDSNSTNAGAIDNGQTTQQAVVDTNNATNNNSTTHSNSSSNADNASQAQPFNFSLAPYTQLKIINSNSFGEILAGAENDLITGFVLAGTGQQDMMLRAQPHTVGMMPSAKLCQLKILNGQWMGDIVGQTEGLKAISHNLSSGAYTVQTSANQQGRGQLGITMQTMNDNLILTNLSTRGFVQSQISHQFVLQGEGFQKILITGIALTEGIDPALSLLSGSDNIKIMSNDDWEQSWQKVDLDVLGLQLGAQESAILAYLHAGTYTVELTAKQQGLGIINIELLQ